MVSPSVIVVNIDELESDITMLSNVVVTNVQCGQHILVFYPGLLIISSWSCNPGLLSTLQQVGNSLLDNNASLVFSEIMNWLTNTRTHRVS